MDGWSGWSTGVHACMHACMQPYAASEPRRGRGNAQLPMQRLQQLRHRGGRRSQGHGAVDPAVRSHEHCSMSAQDLLQSGLRRVGPLELLRRDDKRQQAQRREQGLRQIGRRPGGAAQEQPEAGAQQRVQRTSAHLGLGAGLAHKLPGQSALREEAARGRHRRPCEQAVAPPRAGRDGRVQVPVGRVAEGLDEPAGVDGVQDGLTHMRVALRLVGLQQRAVQLGPLQCQGQLPAEVHGVPEAAREALAPEGRVLVCGVACEEGAARARRAPALRQGGVEAVDGGTDDLVLRGGEPVAEQVLLQPAV
mmetsp:Transcript_37259/g.115980  ORF Transcript_37259/g.115980 Transcript_37259/m.115980 type:complete len:306 (-) Transcript_37259:592-1509(-)